MSLINIVVIRIHVCPWDLERKLVGFSGRFCHTCHTFHTHACHTSHINHTNHTSHTDNSEIMAAPEKRRRRPPFSLWELSTSRLCHTTGAGRDTDPVPRSMCIAMAGGRAREIGGAGKLK